MCKLNLDFQILQIPQQKAVNILFHTTFYYPFLEYTTLLIACLVMEIRSAKHKCYVCGEQDNILPFTEDKEIPKSCDKIDDIKHPKTNPYIFECPTGYNGCITKIHSKLLNEQ